MLLSCLKLKNSNAMLKLQEDLKKYYLLCVGYSLTSNSPATNSYLDSTPRLYQTKNSNDIIFQYLDCFKASLGCRKSYV